MNWRNQAAAGWRGATDALTFGLDDRASAGAKALWDAAHGADIGQAYQSHIADERAQDQYDAQHYGLARTAGQLIGTGTGIALTGPLEGAVAGGMRISQAARDQTR
jgi:hypothetical protein